MHDKHKIDPSKRDWLYQNELAHVTSTAEETIRLVQEAGIITPIVGGERYKHRRYTATAVKTIMDLKRTYGRHWVKAAVLAKRYEPQNDLVTDGTLDIPRQVTEQVDAVTTDVEARTRVTDDVLMLFGIDERLKNISALLERIAVAMERCSTAWER